jgi:disulfide oxidoreductase YuzD
MLKNHILKLTELTNKQEVDEEDIYSFLKKLPTIQKMFIVQNLLTELISIKNPFLETKNKMIEKIENNCYRYYNILFK